MGSLIDLFGTISITITFISEKIILARRSCTWLNFISKPKFQEAALTGLTPADDAATQVEGVGSIAMPAAESVAYAAAPQIAHVRHQLAAIDARYICQWCESRPLLRPWGVSRSSASPLDWGTPGVL